MFIFIMLLIQTFAVNITATNTFTTVNALNTLIGRVTSIAYNNSTSLPTTPNIQLPQKYRLPHPPLVTKPSRPPYPSRPVRMRRLRRPSHLPRLRQRITRYPRYR